METPSSERFPQLFWGLAALGVCMVLMALIGAGAVKSAKRAGDEIEVTGSAKRSIRSDYAIWRLSSATQSPALQDAYRDLSANSARIRRFLTESGVPDSLVTVKPVETEGVYRMTDQGMQTGELAAYKLTQRFEVRSADVNRITALSERAAGLINEGVALQSSAPEYLYTKLSELRTQMLASATEDAMRRAEAIATSAGAGIGAVRSARQGVFQITPRNSTEVSDYGINDTSSLEKDITAVVRVTFAVD
ncbi:MAG TPA: SIMPL domain-containing protein [Longimicrobiaceae bacterium]|nr:SIMPL domain-containing protein [Longimicrobiaceae bacterium]